MAEFHDGPFRVGKIEHGLVPLTWADGATAYRKIRDFRIEVARGGKALAEYDSRKADVVPLKRRRRHAASS